MLSEAYISTAVEGYPICLQYSVEREAQPITYSSTAGVDPGSVLTVIVVAVSHFVVLHFVVVLTLTRIIKSVVTGQDPVTLELRNIQRKNINKTKGGTRIYHP